ncbi:MAG: tRNA1(Val) (adenine(37)-N6)-methyltransferase [Hyphomicrobiales bacterium]
MNTAAEEASDETGFLGGRVRLRQPRLGHRAGTDAALVVAAARPYAKGRVVDLGAGVGAIGLSLAVLDPALEVVLVEIDPVIAALAAETAALNAREDRVRTIVEDARALAADARARRSLGAPYDLVVMNPPFTSARRSQASPDPRRARAHLMEEGDLSQWIGAASALLKPKGALVSIYRPDGLGALLEALQPAFGGIALRPVHARSEDAASRILVFARKGGRAPLSIAPPLILHERDGTFTPLAASIHRGEVELGFR